MPFKPSPASAPLVPLVEVVVDCVVVAPGWLAPVGFAPVKLFADIVDVLMEFACEDAM